MVDHPEIINLKFGLSQLSGNHSLLVKLLGKFKAEYEDLPERLTVMRSNQDISGYRAAVHTVKGVSGNLGLNALHEVSKRLEISVLNELDISQDFREFKSVLEETFQQIQSLSSEPELELEDQGQASQNPAQDAKAQLADTLKRNEFLPPERLSALLETCNIPASQRQQTENAISDLDYAEALRLIDLM